MPSVVATLRVKQDKIDEAKSFLRTLAANVRANEPGTKAYVFHQKKDDPCVFVAYEKYETDEAFKQHGQNLRAQGLDSMAAERVVEASLEALLTRQVTVIPGVRDRLTVAAQRVLPRSLVRRAAGALFQPHTHSRP